MSWKAPWSKQTADHSEGDSVPSVLLGGWTNTFAATTILGLRVML